MGPAALAVHVGGGHCPRLIPLRHEDVNVLARQGEAHVHVPVMMWNNKRTKQPNLTRKVHRQSPETSIKTDFLCYMYFFIYLFIYFFFLGGGLAGVQFHEREYYYVATIFCDFKF